MREVGRDVWTWLAEGAHVYVCGDAKRMAKDVERALVDIAAQHGARSTDEAVMFVSELKKKGGFSSTYIDISSPHPEEPAVSGRLEGWPQTRRRRHLMVRDGASRLLTMRERAFARELFASTASSVERFLSDKLRSLPALLSLEIISPTCATFKIPFY